MVTPIDGDFTCYKYPEGGVAILSAHATEKSANDAAACENGTADVEKLELIGGTITKAKNTSTTGKTPASTAASKKKEDSKADDIPDADPTALRGQTVLFTGELETMTRAQANELAEAAGADTAKGVTKAVTLVVLGHKAGPKKIEQIEKMGLATTDEEGFLEMIKGGGAGAGASSKRAAQDDDDVEGGAGGEEEQPAPKKRSRKAKA
ncbi:hypothetical protein B0J12DRAFT_350316 [Macrophomina phaseolina]|uniref:BRCT domain-containing protein n=1 Tax=Macrophomina phaseolina TaxID=35725 RepID=A0ABQ8FUQ6_9PEZI|nr:hypothetical protein B0J12DRAFT_350316 [Macrophomina phaseolina]